MKMKKHAELLRSLTAMQAALWDVIDTSASADMPGSKAAKLMLSIIAARVQRLVREIAEQEIEEN